MLNILYKCFDLNIKPFIEMKNAWNSCIFFGSEECIVHSRVLSQIATGWPLRCIVYNYYDDMIYCYYWWWIVIHNRKTITFLNLIYFWSSTKGDFQSCQINLTLWQKTILKQYSHVQSQLSLPYWEENQRTSYNSKSMFE